MKEVQSVGHQHLEALHVLLNTPYRENLGVKANKEQVLDKLGFSKGINLALKNEFLLPEDDNTDSLSVREYVSRQLYSGRFLAMLFRDGNWEAMKGFPVVYVMSQEDLNHKLIFNNGKLVEALAQDGSTISVSHKINLQTYSRRQSLVSELSGFVNYDGLIPVRLGGGFRLQIDNFIFIDGQPYMELSGYFSFNDMGSRVLGQYCEGDCVVPRYETSFLLRVDNGQLVFTSLNDYDDEKLILTNEAGIVANQVLGNLFKRDGQAINNLLRGLMSVRPYMKVHQLEGIFSIPSVTEISAEIIDFDGIDSFDLDGQKPQLSVAERLVRGQFNCVGYLSLKPEDLLSYIAFKNKVRGIVNCLVDSPDLTEDIKREISRHVPNFSNIFSIKQTGAVKLGRLINNLDIDWSYSKNPHIRFFQNGDSVITTISVEGYDLAFWKKASNLVDCTDIKALSFELSRITGKEILSVHLSSLREGD